MRAYADSSFIVSLYVPDDDRSARAVAYMRRRQESLPYTPQHRLEVRNAIRLRVWSKQISVADRSRVLRQLDEDLRNETFLLHTPLDFTATYRRADTTGATHNETIGCRSSDLFHVAAALELGFKEFLSFDEKQREIARAVGLKIEL